MRDVYACQLPVQSDDPTAAFADLVATVAADVAGPRAAEVSSAADGSMHLDDDGMLRWRLLRSPGGDASLWTLWLDRPCAGQPELIWTLTARVSLDQGQVAVILHAGVRSGGRRLFPLRFDVEPLPLARLIAEGFEVVEDGWRILPDPAYACDREGAWSLADLLLDERRVLPVVVISPVSSLKGPLVDPQKVGEYLLGLAHVAVLDSPAVTYHLTDRVGPALSTFQGSVRLWWPGLDRHADPREHHLWRPEQLVDQRHRPFERVVLRRLVTAASFRFTTARLEARIQAAIGHQRRQEVDRLWARAEEASLAPEWQKELEHAWKENERLRDEVDDLGAQLVTAQDNLAALVAYRGGGSGDDDPDDPADPDPAAAGPGAGVDPASVAEAVEWAAARCRHLVFLDQAHEGAARATYRQPGRVWRALLAMDDVARAWREGDLGTNFNSAFASRGFSYRPHVSSLALGRYDHEYQRTHEGRVVALGPHLALGRGSPGTCCRIYWYLDEEKRTFVVGHVGNHLSDTTTG